jgi:ATP-dependent exoDNAse (exonuclease V) alpha subunit
MINLRLAVVRRLPYAVTSHSSRGLTADHVLVHVDTSVHPDLVSSRFAYVSVSRASLNARIYTDHAASLGKDLSHDVSKSAAIDLSQSLRQGAAEWGQGIRL